jgi:hypothetical protein
MKEASPTEVAAAISADPHPVYLRPEDFLKTIVVQIPGWLEDVTALRTMDLLSWQEQSGIVGPLLEIGVYGGRYFSILARSAARQGSRVVGIDTFQWISQDRVWQNLQPVRVDSSLIRFENCSSTDLDASDLIGLCDHKPRFISVDGSHELNDVFHDLELVEAVLAPKGIAALDDFLNPLTLGVNEAINLFFSTPRNLRPFAYIRNKLFICRPSFHETLFALVPEVMADKDDPVSQTYREMREAKPETTETMAWGSRIALVP